MYLTILEKKRNKKDEKETEQNGGCHTVSHFSYAPIFQGQHFLKKCWNRTFSMIIYLLTFYLFDNIQKNIIGITHANHSATQRQF